MCASDGSSTRRRRPEHGQSDDAEPVRPRDGRLQRRAADVRRADAHPHDRQGDAQPLPARAVRRRSPVEDRRAGRKGRAPRAHDHSDRRQVRRQQRAAVSGHLERSLHHRRRVRHGRGVRERRHHGRGPADDQCRRAVRPQPRHQSGPARARSEGRETGRHRPRPGHAVHVERVCRRAWVSPRSSPPTAERCCGRATGGSARAC